MWSKSLSHRAKPNFSTKMWCRINISFYTLTKGLSTVSLIKTWCSVNTGQGMFDFLFLFLTLQNFFVLWNFYFLIRTWYLTVAWSSLVLAAPSVYFTWIKVPYGHRFNFSPKWFRGRSKEPFVCSRFWLMASFGASPFLQY